MFDIRQKPWDEHGEVDDTRMEEYIDGLMEEFAGSVEAQPIIDQQRNLSWSAIMMDYVLNYLGLTPPEMSLSDFDEVLFELFPRKVSTEADAAEEIVTELKAFWTFVGRQYGVKAARKIVASLDDEAVQSLHDELADPSNFGMAKSFFELGAKAGFDMTNQQGLNEFMSAYNNGLLANPRDKISFSTGRASSFSFFGGSPLSGHQRADKRKKRKQQRQARKRQRR